MPRLITDLPDQIRSAPAWLIIAVLVLLAVLLIGALPLAGYLIERKRRMEGFVAIAAYEGDAPAFFAGLPEDDRPQRFGALDVTFAGQPAATGIGLVFPAFEGEEPAEPTEAEIDEAVEAAEEVEDGVIIALPLPEADPAPEVEETPATETGSWTGEPTAAWDMSEIFEGEVVRKSPEMEAFEADPLGAWYVPEEAQDNLAYLPEADRVFRDLVIWNKLTGIGADIDAEWQAWDLEGASA